MIQHVTREVRPSELEQCIAFYGVLGFERVPTPPGIGERAIWLERSGSQIHLMPRADAARQSGHVGVVLEDYEATLERLARFGYDVERRREHWGSPRAYVRDPAGNLVEVMEWGPGAPPRG